MTAPLLDIANLEIAVGEPGHGQPIVRDLSLHLGAGEVLCLVGESGCGKSLTGQAVLGVFPPGAHLSGGTIRFKGRDLAALREPELNRVRGRGIAMIFQDPIGSLNPLMPIGRQLTEVLGRHRGMTGKAAWREAVTLLDLVEIPDAKARMSAFPHEISGGMAQRVAIASALACKPDLLIADEPTTALDVTIQAQILDLLLRLRKDTGMAMWIDAATDRMFEVINPADGKIIARIAKGEAEDVDRAVAAARKAFDDGRWTTLTPSERTRVMWKLADLLEANCEEIAIIETLDNGKPLAASRADVLRGAEKLRYCAGWITKMNGESVDSALPEGWHGYTVREPIGVAGLIVPWNFPLAMAVNKIAPALAAGCTMVLKPAEQTPLSALRLGELFADAGIPDGVVNIVTGFGADAGAALSAHPDVDKISFTGSTDVGKMIVSASTGNLKRLSLELGGKSPVFVFPDADLDKTIAGASQFIFGNTGQNCGAGSRLFIHQDVHDQVLEGISERAKALGIGSGLDPQTQIGPIISSRQIERVMGYIRSGQSDGANIIVGGNRVERDGYFVEPTILTDTRSDMSVWREEIFGPVLCAVKFSDIDLDRLAAAANDTNYGLGAYVWTRELGIAHKMARKIKAGFVRVNGGAHHNVLPFGGYKQSGWGRENGREGIELFTEIKSVIVGY